MAEIICGDSLEEMKKIPDEMFRILKGWL